MKGSRLAITAVFLVALLSCSIPKRKAQPVDHLRSWSNTTVTEGEDPHAYGIGIELWKHNGEFTGFIDEYAGSVADPPAAKLESIQFDEKTGTISWAARLSIGAVFAQDKKEWIPAKYLYEFKGVAGADTMKGSLRKTLLLESGKGTVEEESIVLKNNI